MKTILRLAALLLLSNNIVNAQAPNWLWAEQPGGNGYGNSIATDAGGHIYVTGYFNGQSIHFGNTTLLNGGNYNAFLAKYDALGNVLWAIGPASGVTLTYHEGQAVSTDPSGNVFMAGFFTNSNMVIGGDTLIYPGNGVSFFITKCDSDGNVLWAKTANALTIAECSGITSDISGNVYATGFFSGPNIIFGNDTLTFTGSQNNNSSNTFIVKYDASGNVVWAKNYGANSSPASISTDANRYVYLSGGFSGPGNLIFGNDSLTYTDREHSFLVKYNSTGNVIWAKRTAGSGGIGIDMNSNIYLTGSYDSTVIFGSDTLTNVFAADILTGGPSYSVFHTKYDASGNVVWAKSSGTSQIGLGTAKGTDSQGNSYVTGVYSSPAITFGTDTLLYTNGDTTGGEQIFVVKYDTAGNVVWAKNTGGGSVYPFITPVNSTICTDASGNCYLTGWFSSPDLTFDDITLNDLQGGSFTDIFVAKLSNVATGINEVKSSVNAINVYPNPSTATFNFKGVPTGSTIQVYTVVGEMIYTATTNTDNYRFNLNGHARGIYFYAVSEHGNSIQQGKIVLK